MGREMQAFPSVNTGLRPVLKATEAAEEGKNIF